MAFVYGLLRWHSAPGCCQCPRHIHVLVSQRAAVRATHVGCGVHRDIHDVCLCRCQRHILFTQRDQSLMDTSPGIQLFTSTVRKG